MYVQSTGLGDAVAAADSGWSVIAIALIGLYALGWRWGGKILDALKENTKVTREAKVVAEEAKDTAGNIAEAIVTNHGSKNMGEAIDRITEWLVQHMEDSRASDEQLRQLQAAFVARVIEIDHARDQARERFIGIDDQLSAIRKHIGMKEPEKE